MKEKDKNLRKKAALDYLLALIFDNSPNELAEHLHRKQQEQLNEDPFLPPPPIVPSEPKPLKFLMNTGGERFKALKQKVLAKEQEETVPTLEPTGDINGPTGS